MKKTNKKDDRPGELAKLFPGLFPIVDGIVIQDSARSPPCVRRRQGVACVRVGTYREAVALQREFERAPEALVRGCDQYDFSFCHLKTSTGPSSAAGHEGVYMFPDSSH